MFETNEYDEELDFRARHCQIYICFCHLSLVGSCILGFRTDRDTKVYVFTIFVAEMCLYGCYPDLSWWFVIKPRICFVLLCSITTMSSAGNKARLKIVQLFTLYKQKKFLFFYSRVSSFCFVCCHLLNRRFLDFTLTLAYWCRLINYRINNEWTWKSQVILAKFIHQFCFSTVLMSLHSQ